MAHCQGNIGHELPEVQPIRLLAEELSELHKAGQGVLDAYIRNVKLKLFDKSKEIYLEVRR